MTSKTFKHSGTNGDESKLDICQVPAGIRLTLSTHTTISGWFDPKQGAEIALAILEAAGIDSAVLAEAEDYLKSYIEVEAKHAAEAKAQAELEAEALELLNTEREYIGADPVRDLSEVHAVAREAAIAVARRARELAEKRAEK